MKLNKAPLNWWERIYLVEILKGLGVTLRHLVGNLRNRKHMPTIEYPEVRPPIHPRFRGRHRLKRYRDGRFKCTACMLCATACPAHCIYIEAGEYADNPIEKYPVRFEIDLLRCVYCGLCEEACPCDSIHLDTGIFAMACDDRRKGIIDRDALATITDEERGRNL